VKVVILFDKKLDLLGRVVAVKYRTYISHWFLDVKTSRLWTYGLVEISKVAGNRLNSDL